MKINEYTIESIDRHNWEEALALKIYRKQKEFVPSPLEALACAYIKPWDEAFDPYLFRLNGRCIGMFYLSYTPQSTDNYWLGGFFIDKKYQNKGYGREIFSLILSFIQERYPECRELSLTVERHNAVASGLYESFGFKTEGAENKLEEVIYHLTFC